MNLWGCITTWSSWDRVGCGAVSQGERTAELKSGRHMRFNHAEHGHT